MIIYHGSYTPFHSSNCSYLTQHASSLATSMSAKPPRPSSRPYLQPHPSVAQLLAAVDDGDADKVSKLLQANKVYVDISNKHGESPLHIAAGYGNLPIIEILCKNNATLDILDKQGDTPLYWAARHGHLEVVKFLCSEGAEINTQDNAGETALHVCARYDQPEVLAHLCQARAKLNIQDNDGDTPLLCGTWHGYQKVVECLVQAGSSLQRCNKDGETPLHVAAVRGYFSLVKYFCEKGADLDTRDKLGCTPVQLATRRNHEDIVRYLCQQGCKLDLQNVNGDTVMHDACREGQNAIFMAILNAKCNLDIPNKNKATPLHLAAKYGHKELIRHLCLSGCDVNAATENGFTADKVAGRASQGELASLLRHLREGNFLDQYIQDLAPEQICLSRVKLFVCGATGVGKTELIKSMKCHFLRSLFRRRSDSNLSHMIQQRTHGILVHQLTIPNSGNFSIWDFSGLKSYYSLHEEFLSVTNALILLVFKLCDSVEKQMAQLRFWLALIKAKQSQSDTIRFGGEREHKPCVVLVGSFANVPTTDLRSETEEVYGELLDNAPVDLQISSFPEEQQGALVLEAVKNEFGNYFNFSEHVFQLDCRLSQTSEMKALRQHLGALRCNVIQTQSKTTRFVQLLSQSILEWREEYEGLPVLTWQAFLEKARLYVNPLATEELMVRAVSALHDMGEVVYIKEGPLCNIVVLDPMWLGLRIFGPALSPENSVIPQLKSVTGYVNLSTLQRVYPELDPSSIINLFEHFELCTPVDDNRFTFLFPSLIKMEPIFGIWEQAPEFTVYAGIRVSCQTAQDIFSPSVLPKIQICARKVFSHDIEDQELTLWRGGLKCCRGGVEVLLSYPETCKCIEIFVRGAEETRLECYYLLQQFYEIVVGTIRVVNPGSAFMTEIVSSKRLREHKPALLYSPTEIFAAERGDGVLKHVDMPGLEESILDVVCCGCEELLAATKSAPYTALGDISTMTKNELSCLLDPPDPLGRDWCLLSLQLLFTEEVARIDQAEDQSSPTIQLLTEWNKSVQSTVVTVIDALRAIGREDAASVLIRGLSPFSNPRNSVVINVPGVPMTSYLC